MTERDDDWAGELWPDDDDWPDSDPLTGRQLHKGTALPHGMPSRRRLPMRLMMTAVVAIAAGVGGALAVRDITASSSPALTGQSGHSGTGQPGARPGGSQAGPGQLPRGVSARLMIGGKVTSVSLRSITIAAGPQSVTARVTGSTRYSGKVTGIAGVRVGDMVLAQVSVAGGVDSLVALQDPLSAS